MSNIFQDNIIFLVRFLKSIYCFFFFLLLSIDFPKDNTDLERMLNSVNNVPNLREKIK